MQPPYGCHPLIGLCMLSLVLANLGNKVKCPLFCFAVYTQHLLISWPLGHSKPRNNNKFPDRIIDDEVPLISMCFIWVSFLIHKMSPCKNLPWSFRQVGKIVTWLFFWDVFFKQISWNIPCWQQCANCVFCHMSNPSSGPMEGHWCHVWPGHCSSLWTLKGRKFSWWKKWPNDINWPKWSLRLTFRVTFQGRFLMVFWAPLVPPLPTWVSERDWNSKCTTLKFINNLDNESHNNQSASFWESLGSQTTRFMYSVCIYMLHAWYTLYNH